ncbi:MAG: hypothetical protein COB36_08930 [Alphaproteobacteria bacterium]|nr:MAG: hypothetical protein COB36_08930 [Alphaproteobacteria bacterium]
MAKEKTTETNNPFTEELGFKQPIVIHNENGYTIQRTDKNNDLQVLTHVGWKSEKYIESYDVTSGLAQYHALKNQGIEGIKDYMSETAKPLVITTEFTDELKFKKLAEEIERAASAEGMKKDRTVGEGASTVTAGTHSLSAKTSATIENSHTKSKGKAATSDEPAVRSYEQKLSKLHEENENMDTLGTAFSLFAIQQTFKNWQIKDIFANLLPKKSGNNNDYEQKMDL